MNTKMTPGKRILSVLLTVIMVFSMVPLSVFAADGAVAEVTIGSTTTPYSDLASAFSAAQYASGSATVKLLENVDNFAAGNLRTDGVQLNSGDVTFDLNGHYLLRYNNAAGTNANKKAVFYVTGSAKLTVMDSVGGGEIIQPLDVPALIVDSGASLTVLSGKILNTKTGYGIRIDGGTLAVEGGTVSASFDAGICVVGGTVTVTGDPEIHGGKSSALLVTGESSVTLSGGTYTTNETNKRSILTNVGKVTDLLAEGFRFTDSNGMDVAITEDGKGTDSDYVIVSDFGIKYIDADGVEQKCTSFTELTEATDLSSALSGWYAVKGTVSITRSLGVTADNTLNLILCDGAELDLQYTLYLMGGATLNIYGQSGGTGKLTAKSRNHNPGIGLVYNTNAYNGTVNIYGGTVVAQSSGGDGAQAIGLNPSIMTGKVDVTIAKGLKCVKTDDQNTAYAYDNTDGTSITITKCTEHKWSYTNITNNTHDRTCDLCGMTEMVAHSPARYQGAPNTHRVYCVCGKNYATERHSFTFTPNDDGLTHKVTCAKCGEVTKKDETHSFSNKIESEGRTWYACECGANYAATYDGKKYASLQTAIDAAAPVGGTVTLAQQVNENVVVTDGTVTIDLGGNRWSADISDSKKGYVPLTVNGGSVTLKNGNLFQGSSTSTYETGIVINGGSVTVEEDARVRGGTLDRDVQCPSITLNGGNLMLKEGATLLSGLQVPENKVLADYLPEGTAFVKCSYDNSSNTVTVSDPQEFVPDVYTTNKITEGMVIVSHTHDFSDDENACACGFTCAHDGGNDREAGYFEKAICSVCHAEYGDYLADTTAPTGEIVIQGRPWWQTVLNKISFGLFFKEDASMIITATDDSYSQAGFDETKHAVKIEYFVSDGILSEEAVENSTEFRDYTIPMGFSTERQYVVYVRLTDHAGNIAYAGSNGFEIDKTAPRIDGMKNYGVYSFCGEKTITVTDITATNNNNIDKVSMDGAEITLDENGQYTLPVDSVNHRIIVTDKAGNQTTVDVTVFPSHDFDKTFDTCNHCGTPAAAKVENGDISDRFATGDELFKALADAKYKGATVTLLTDLTFTKNVSPSGDVQLQNDLTIDLNGKTLQGPENGTLVVFGGAVRIRSLNGEGTLATNLCVFGANASLTMDNGIGEAEYVMFRLGNLTIRSGRYARLNIVYAEGDVADLITLYGGSYDSVYLAEAGSATAEQILGKGCRYDGVSYSTAQGKKSLSKVSVIPCDHSELNDFVCTGCGMEIFLSAEKNGETTLFGTFEDAIRYAEQNKGCTVKLLRDLTLDDATVGDLRENTYGCVEFTKGTYTLDLAGKTLTAGDWNNYYAAIKICDGCDLTITDSVGGKVVSEINTVLDIRSGSHLTIEGGDYSSFGSVKAEGPDSLTLKGGRFKQVCSREARNSVSPLRYLADGYAFMLTDKGVYAGEKNVESQVISGKGTAYSINNVTVVHAPVYISAGLQPQDKTFYLTSPDAKKRMSAWVVCRDLDTDKKITLTLEKTDGTAVMSSERDYAKNGFISETLDLKDLAESSELYRVKIEFDGYVGYSNTFRITVAVCEHPGYDEDNKCTQCECALAAAIVKDGKTTGYTTVAEALTAAQTDENKGCTLKLLADVSGKIVVGTGDFYLNMNGHTASGLNVTKTAKLSITGGMITGAVVTAKAAELNASALIITGAVNCTSSNTSFVNCTIGGTLSAKGSPIVISGCTLNDALSVSGSDVTVNGGSISGEITVNNGGGLQFLGEGGKYGAVLVKTGATMKVCTENTFTGAITAESGSTLTIENGSFTGEVTAESGSTLTIENGSFGTVNVRADATCLLSGGSFQNIYTAGRLMDCLAEGTAFQDDKGIIDGRNPHATGVQAVDHTHTCVWKTDTHEKLCGCGYVEAVDTEAPVISSIKDGGVYYNLVYFSVTDANDFTVTVDGTPVQILLTGYLLLGDNQTHTITATDVAGNTATVTVTVYKLYFVTLPRDTAGYTVKGVSAVGHGMDYEFTVKIADGYSKTENYRVLVNGAEIDAVKGDETEDTFLINNVSEELVITVEGVADITAPEVEVSIRGNSFKEFLNRITFGLFFKQTQSVEVKADDFGSGIKKVEYILSETAFTDKDAITGDWTELTLNESRKAYFSIEPNQKTFIYVRVTDQSDNITVVNSDGVVVYTDAEAVTEAVSCTVRRNADVSFAVRLNGNTVAALYNGSTLIDGSSYTVSADGTITLKGSWLSTLAAGEYTIRVQYNPMGMSLGSGDEPAMTSVKLTVERETPVISLEPGQRVYNGKSLNEDDFHYFVFYDGAPLWEYKPAGADDSAYTTTAPKNVGRYIVRLTLNETDTYKAASQTTEFEITPKEVTISGVKVDNKVYDGKTEASIANIGTVRKLIDGDTVTVKAGTASFDDKNVGVGKTVTFTDFALSGDDAANYVLSAQPASTTANITQKELTIADLKIKDKRYDGKSTAEIDGTPTLVGVVDGDVLTLVNGVPTFDSVKIGKNIPVSFTAFTLSGDRVTVANYTLTQPSGITANIVEYVADGSEYSVNSNDWLNKDFVITAKDGYKLSLADTANGEWVDSLTASDETGNGKLTFFVKNTETGVISAAVTESYKIDKTAPTGEVKLNERTAFQKFINTITFGLFFKDDVNVKLTAKDEASGVKSVLYFKSDKILTDDEVRAITDWTDNSNFDIEAKDMDRFVIYVRIEDNAGNVTFIGSDGATFDTTAPEIVGVINGSTYYVTKKVAIDDENLESVTLNGKSVKDVFTLAGDTELTYIIRAVDKAGNVTEYTVYMKPISSITDAISGVTVDHAKSSDAEKISAVERQVLDIAEAFDDGESTEDEWNKLTKEAAKCKDLNGRIAEVAEEITRLTDAVNGYDIDKVTSVDKADTEKLIADIDTLLNGDNLTESERAALEALKGTARALLDRIAAAKGAAEADEITAVDGITKDNVKREDKEALETAEKALEGALRDFDGNYTDKEQENLETKLETVKAALTAIGNAEKAADEIGKLPSADDAKLSDKSELDRVKKLLEGLTENEKAMLDKDVLGKVDALAEKIKKLAEDENSPKTGDTSNPALWIALLFISGGIVTGTTVVSKKKRRSEK